MDGHRSLSTGTQAGPDIAPVRSIEIPPGVAQKPGLRGPAAAAQDLVGPEPRLGIFFVRIGDKTGIRQKIVGRPFPDIADHLPAAEGTVSRGQSSHVNGPWGLGLE